MAARLPCPTCGQGGVGGLLGLLVHPCRQEAPVLEEVYREYAGPEVEFIGVNIWDLPDNAATYAEDFDLTYPSGMDTDGVIAIDYGVRGIPEKVSSSAGMG